jgi:pyridoxal phosphate enzyme (YggS family)
VPASVKIVAVSKTKPVSDILEAYTIGQRIFGENRVKELLVKKDQLPGDIEWHMIGHLQSNKVKGILPFIKMIQSVDSFRLLKVINDESQKINRKTDCLLEIHIAGEETKSGFNFDELLAMCGSPAFKGFSNVNIRGVMGMATFTSDSIQVRKEFIFLKKCFDSLKTGYFRENECFNEISMGMSGDYKIAVEEGSTMIRVGSLIFGERNL